MGDAPADKTRSVDKKKNYNVINMEYLVSLSVMQLMRSVPFGAQVNKETV